MENWQKIFKIVLPIAIVILLIGAYAYFKIDEASRQQLDSLAQPTMPKNENSNLNSNLEESENKATADENFVLDPQAVSNAQITPPDGNNLDIEPDPGVIDKLSAPE